MRLQDDGGWLAVTVSLATLAFVFGFGAGQASMCRACREGVEEGLARAEQRAAARLEARTPPVSSSPAVFVGRGCWSETLAGHGDGSTIFLSTSPPIATLPESR